MLALSLVPKSHHDLIGATLALAVLTSACAAHAPVQATAPEPPAVVATAYVPAPPAPQVPTDPVADLIAASSTHFETGQHELQLGHLDAARTEFNKALEVLLESSYGTRSEPRIREHFDRLVERISAFEVTALAQGDGFAEKK